MTNLQLRTDERGVTTLTLDRPEVYNAMNRAFIDELTSAVQSLNNTRVLLIDANGKHFCAGADINWMKASATLTDQQNHDDAMALSQMLDTLNSCPFPTVAKVQGAALGGGTGLVCCCDIVVASESSRFAFSEVKLGIIPATISPYALLAIGARAARRYFLTGEQIDAYEAHRLGLVHDVCPSDNLESQVQMHVSNLLNASPNAQKAAKQLVQETAGKPIDLAHRENLAKRLARIRASDDAQEGLSAFLEKRTPNWSM